MVIDFIWVIFAFFCGSLPLAYWLGNLVLKVDIRQYGDGNPGGANVWKASGSGWGITAILLDSLKGLIPVALALYLGGVAGWWLLLVSIAPVVGHVFSPFLKFQGGKALATTFGVWTALTLYQVPMAFGISLGLWIWLLKSESWAILAGVFSVLVFLLVGDFDLVLVSTWIVNSVILVWRYSDNFFAPRQPE